MKIVIATLAAFATLLVISTPARGGQSSADDLRESLRRAEEGFAQAFAERDLQKFASFIDDDAVFLKPDGTAFEGKAAVVEGWKGMVTSEKAPFSWKPTRYRVSPSGTMGLSTGPVLDPDGKKVGVFMSTWKRYPDGSWKVIFDGAPEK